MSKNHFQEDLQTLYTLISKRQKELAESFAIVEDEAHNQHDMEEIIDTFLAKMGLESSKQNRLSALSRLISLRDEQLIQSMTQAGFTQEQINQAKEQAYQWVRDFHLARHEELLKQIESQNLLTPFYRTLLRGVHEVGVHLSRWQSSWNEHIIEKINPKLQAEFGNNVMEFLDNNELFDKDPNGNKADRSYSVLDVQSGEYCVKTYSEFFGKEVKLVCESLEKLVHALENEKDDETGQKEAYITYFDALALAFGQKDHDKILEAWMNVDRAWMDVTSPIQVGHPLEYYEDHYRKAVALEWDVRLSNPKQLGAQQTYMNVLKMYSSLFEQVGSGKEHVYELSLQNLKRVGLYIGRPALYYGAEFNGLFSAQVVPNDETVSKERGKKIFAFADNILDSIRAKPFLKISTKVFGTEFMNVERELVFKKPELWHRVYEVTTIGHEYGHILWLDHDTESLMNKSGVFKNIEEFKATMGGLMAFFSNEDAQIKDYVLRDTIKRSVGLIAWMKTGEVEPYYCEGLIHLSGMFASGVLSFDGVSLHIDTSEEAYERLKSWYTDAYKLLAQTYLDKVDASQFLHKFAVKQRGVYMPVAKEVKEFVEFYWSLHQSIGRDVDEEVLKSEWV